MITALFITVVFVVLVVSFIKFLSNPDNYR